MREPSSDEILDAQTWAYSGSTALERARGSASTQASADDLAARAADGRTHFTTRRSMRFYAMPIAANGRVVAVVVSAAPNCLLRRCGADRVVGLGSLGRPGRGGAIPVLWFAAARALRPVNVMAAQASERSAHAVHERFGDHQRHTELAVLADSLDDLLDRVAAVMRHEQQLSAELSHELRTPLTRITAEVDLVRSGQPSPAGLSAAHEAIADTAAEMAQIIDTLLSAARLQAFGLPGTCDLRVVVHEAVSRLGPTAVRVTVDGPPVSAGVDGAVVARILGPILDNAVRYAVSEVAVTLGKAGHQAMVDVADDGPGVAPAALETVFQPGYRQEPADQHEGAGLGLALSRRLARAADGDVVALEARGGLFRATLPPA